MNSVGVVNYEVSHSTLGMHALLSHTSREMPFSFHSHSGQFCHHAKGTLEEVVQEAIRKGFRIYGLSEHMPRYRDSELYPEEIEAGATPAILQTTLAAFIEAARILQLKYRSQITLLVGVEIEYVDASYTDHVRRLSKAQKPDYIIGSLHHTRDIPIDFSEELYTQAMIACGGDVDQLYCCYFDEQYSMLVDLQPKIIGHFDLIRIFAPRLDNGREITSMSELVWQKVVRNIDFVIGYGGLFEVNSRAWKKGLTDAYPGTNIIKDILDKNGKITLSDDSHGPADVGMHYNKLKSYLVDLGVRRLHYLDYDFEKCEVEEKVLENWDCDEFWRKFQD